MTAAPSQQKERKTNSLELKVTIALTLIVWIFSAGILWQKVDDLEKKVDLIERVLLKPNPTLSER